MLEKTLKNPLDSKEIKPVHPKGNQPWIFTGRTDAEAEAPIVWPPDAKNWLTGKDPDARKDWGRSRREQQRMRWLDDITESMDMSLSKLQEIWRTGNPGVLQSMGLWRVEHDWVTKQHQRYVNLSPHLSQKYRVSYMKKLLGKCESLLYLYSSRTLQKNGAGPRESGCMSKEWVQGAHIPASSQKGRISPFLGNLSHHIWALGMIVWPLAFLRGAGQGRNETTGNSPPAQTLSQGPL